MTKDFLRELKNKLEDMINKSLECGNDNVHKLINTYERVLEMCEKYEITESKSKTEELERVMSKTEEEILKVVQALKKIQDIVDNSNNKQEKLNKNSEGVSLNFKNNHTYIPKEHWGNVKIVNGSLILGQGCTIFCDKCNKENNKINLSIHLDDDFEIEDFKNELMENINRRLQQHKY